MRTFAGLVGALIIMVGLVACGGTPSSASERGDAIEPVTPDEGSGSAAIADRAAAADSASMLDTVTIEDAITVIGTGAVAVEPDEAVVHVSVTVTGETVAEARDEAASLMADVLDAIRATGIADRDLQTANLSVQPVYEYDDGVGTRDGTRVVGYRVDNGVRVTVRDLDALAAVVDDAMDAGATGLDGVTFRVSDPSAAEAEARRLAVDDARARAEALAEAAGVTLGRVLAIGEAQASPIWPYDYGREASAGGTPIVTGTAEISVSVQIAWAIE
jgi:uncharacterized protein YggE